MNAAQLTTIAAAMRRELPLVGRTERVVKNGASGPVYLRLMRRFDRVQLYVGHRDCYPDPESAAQIAALFGAGPEAEPIRQKTTIASQDGRYITVPCLIYAWTDTDVAGAH